MLKTSLSLLTVTSLALSISACGGSDGDKIKDEYDRIEHQIKGEYLRAERKLSNNEKSMKRILESIFVPEESLDKFLDKITPEGGQGGLFVGHFIELDDNDPSDIDVGAIYFDISKDVAGKVDGRISYQQQRCQENNTIATDSAVKIDNKIAGKVSGSLDTLQMLDIDYVDDWGIETPNILTTFYGSFKETADSSLWSGSFEYQDSLGGKKLSSGIDGCSVTYTLSHRANFDTYPLDYQLGSLNIAISGNGSKTQLTWDNPINTQLVLVSQIDISAVKSGVNGYKVNQVFTRGEASFTPVITAQRSNYAFVVQAFDNQNRLIGYQAIIKDLP